MYTVKEKWRNMYSEGGEHETEGERDIYNEIEGVRDREKGGEACKIREKEKHVR